LPESFFKKLALNIGSLGLKKFSYFILISGAGWLLDMIAYAGLSEVLRIKASYANFISSMIGVTYVWIFALDRFFGRRESAVTIFLLIYWCYQGMSILAYSFLVSKVAESSLSHIVWYVVGISSALSAKIIITLPNVLTNYIFISTLMKFMSSDTKRQHLL
jgi:hypothetical protein